MFQKANAQAQNRRPPPYLDVQVYRQHIQTGSRCKDRDEGFGKFDRAVSEQSLSMFLTQETPFQHERKEARAKQA